MSTIKSSSEDLTLDADGGSSEIKLKINNVEKASISSAGAFTSTTIDATALTTVPVNKGGTGATTHTANNVLVGNGTSAVGSVAPGVDGQVLTSTGSAWQSEALPASGITLGTPVATTSGTSHSFTGIPSGTKRITINWDQMDTDGTVGSMIQLGDSGGFETSGYVGAATRSQDSGTDVAITTGMAMMAGINDVLVVQGSMVLSLLDSSTNTWSSMCVLGRSDAYTFHGGSSKSLSGELTQIKMLVRTGSSNYDGGKMNIMYE